MDGIGAMAKRIGLVWFFAVFLYCSLVYGAGTTIDKRLVLNGIYKVIVLDEVRQIRLQNGEYDKGTIPFKDRNYLCVKLDQMKLSDINGDGVEDAVVILYSSRGGSGSWANLTGFVSGAKDFSQIEPVFLGDRVVVNRIQIRRLPSGGFSLVCLKMLTHGPEDPSCCPSKKETRCFKLTGRDGKWGLEDTKK